MNKKYCEHNGKRIAYVDEGNGDPIIFFHGNPTSSYLYRNIILDLKDEYHCFAADMIGMGDSDKLDNSSHMTYTFQTHYEYLCSFIESFNKNAWDVAAPKAQNDDRGPRPQGPK